MNQPTAEELNLLIELADHEVESLLAAMRLADETGDEDEGDQLMQLLCEAEATLEDLLDDQAAMAARKAA